MCNLFRTFIKARKVVIFAFVCVFSVLGVLQTYGQSRQLSLADILIALRSKKAEIEEKNRILAEAVKDRGVTFALTPEIEKELDGTGARSELIAAIRTKSLPPPTSVAVQKPAPPKENVPQPKSTPAPPDYSYYRNRATTDIANGDLDLAVADLGRALEFKPTDAGSYLDRAITLAKQNKTEAASKDFDKTIELDPKNPAAYLNRAQMFEKLGNVDRAIADYDKVYELDPSSDQAKSSAVRLREAQAAAAKKAEPAKPQTDAEAVPTLLTVGALNSWATTLAIPSYSSTAKKMGIQGRVTVQIILDVDGKVISAKATDGPKALLQSAEEAIRRSKFKPVKMDEKAVKASGFIVYNFVAN